MPKSPNILSPQLRTNARTRSGSGDNYYDNHDFGSVFLQSFLSFEKMKNDTAERKDLSKFIELPSSTVHPHAQNHLQKKAKAKHTTKKSSPRHNEGRHIKKLRKTLLGGNTKLQQQQQQQRSTKGSPLPYVEANTKISRVLKHVKLKSKKEDMQASRLNVFYKLVQKETAAAIVLQSHCRRILATVQVRQFANQTAQAIKIQCCTRQFIARKVLKELQCAKLKATLIRERIVRLYVARCRRRNQIKLEYNAAVTCQSSVRMYFAKRILRSKKMQHSWEVNQMRWQLISLRLTFANAHIIKSLRAVQIQCVVRRRLAQTRVASIQLLYTKAAIRIQCCWRRYEAQQRNKQILYEHAVEQQCNKVRTMMSEHNYWKEKAAALQTEPKLQLKSDLEMQKGNLIEKQRQKQEEICALETHFEDQTNLLQEITPQEVEGGWEEQVKLNLVDTRERITTAKLDFLFDIQLKLKSVENKLNTIYSNEKEVSESVKNWGNWRQAEQDALWAFQRQHDDEVEEKEARKRIIDEQMKWKVKFTVPSGKPKKQSRGLDVSMPTSGTLKALADETARKISKVQELNHLNRTWQPFEKMSSTLFEALQRQVVESKQQSVQHVDEEFTPIELSSSSNVEGIIENALEAFPQRIPFEQIREAREEKEAIDRITAKR